MPEAESNALPLAVTNATPVATVDEAKTLADNQPGWLVGYDRDIEDTEEYLATLTAHADARLWARLHEEGQMKSQGGPYERGSEVWAGLVAQEVLRMMNNIETANRAALNALLSEIQRRALYDRVFGNYTNLQEMLLDVAQDLSSAGQASEHIAVAEIIVPWLVRHQDDCVCDHPHAEHNPQCSLCDCEQFLGPPTPQEFWKPGNWEKLRTGVALMKAIIASEEEGKTPLGEAIEGMWNVVQAFTDPNARVKDLRWELAKKRNPPIQYRLERVVPPGQEAPDEELKWALTFPEVTREQRDLILGRLGARAQQVKAT